VAVWVLECHSVKPAAMMIQRRALSMVMRACQLKHSTNCEITAVRNAFTQHLQQLMINRMSDNKRSTLCWCNMLAVGADIASSRQSPHSRCATSTTGYELSLWLTHQVLSSSHVLGSFGTVLSVSTCRHASQVGSELHARTSF
jgi:hypothetical protein